MSRRSSTRISTAATAAASTPTTAAPARERRGQQQQRHTTEERHHHRAPDNATVYNNAGAPLSDNLRVLRQHWKWAAFCQFFYIFFELVAIHDISIEDIENDLGHGTDVFLPRVMQRLLYTLTYDRKITTENWQNALRRQYERRNPEANPLGSQSTVHTAASSRYSSVLKDEVSETGEEADREGGDQEEKAENKVGEGGDEHPEAEATDGETNPEDAMATEDQPPAKTRKIEQQREASEQKTTVDWSELTMEQKLDSMHMLTEWQFQNPTRLRHLMKSDDEDASWRSEPVGYDREQNAYWLIGGNRMWIQRAPPKPPSRKRKRKAAEPEPRGRNASFPKAGPSSSKRQRTSKTQTSSRASKKEKEVAAATVPVTASPGIVRSSRAAKEQAKIKLDEQAKALAEFNRQAARMPSGATASPSGRATRSTRGGGGDKHAATSSSLSARTPVGGVRISARLRGRQDDGWQPVPEEWLQPESSTSSSKKRKKTGLETDDESVSDLTELSDDNDEEEEDGEEAERNEEEAEEVRNEDEEEKEEVKPQVKQDQDKEDVEEAAAAAAKANFVEWETICLTLWEWEHFAERFEKTTHYTEKAFYKFLTTIIVPQVVAELREIENKRRLEEALNHRKRSSRLATRENEREAAKLAAQKKAEEAEKMSRTRRLEARQQREEADRLKREKAREERRMKRETKVAADGGGADDDGDGEHENGNDNSSAKEDGGGHSSTRSEQETHSRTKRQTSRGARQRQRPKQASSTAGSDDWELDCEVCGRAGKNLDDGTPMMSCGLCSKWQHIQCHDKRERALGRPKRDWDRIEFFCQRCLALRANGMQYQQQQQQQQQQHRSNGASSRYHHYSQHQPPHMAMSYPQPQQQQQSWQAQAAYGSAGSKLASGVPSHGYGGQYSQEAYAHLQQQQQHHSQSSYNLAPTSSLRSSSYASPQQAGYGSVAAGAPGAGAGYGDASNHISFSHYQPQEKAFTSASVGGGGSRGGAGGRDAVMQQLPPMPSQNSYYRVNGNGSSWGGAESARYQAYPSQSYHHPPGPALPSSSSTSGASAGAAGQYASHVAATATGDRSRYPYENGNVPHRAPGPMGYDHPVAGGAVGAYRQQARSPPGAPPQTLPGGGGVPSVPEVPPVSYHRTASYPPRS